MTALTTPSRPDSEDDAGPRPLPWRRMAGVLLGDLIQENLVTVTEAAPRGRVTGQRLLGKVFEGLRAL